MGFQKEELMRPTIAADKSLSGSPKLKTFIHRKNRFAYGLVAFERSSDLNRRFFLGWVFGLDDRVIWLP